jgi:SAM-dependent methyltransferase
MAVLNYMMKNLRYAAKAFLRPAMPVGHYVRRALQNIPQVGQVAFGDLRRTKPISAHFGFDRGLPVDRFYIQRFLEQYAADVHGRVLEIGEDIYTRRYGKERVSRADVLNINANPRATIVADLTHAPQIPDSQFDAIIFTQTLQYIFDHAAALRTLRRILKPGGSLLLTVPGITHVEAASDWDATWYWSFTEPSMRKLLSDAFPGASIEVRTYGNVLASTALLQGIAAQELEAPELEVLDPCYPVTISARVQKANEKL